MSTVLLVILIVVLLGGIGTYPGFGPVQHTYGWYPSGGFGLIFIILLVLLLTGRI